MEKKKLLLVAISVGIFLVITIGAAILVFTPRNAAASSAVAYRPNSGTGNNTAPLPTYLPSASALDPQAQENTESLQPGPVDAVELVRRPGDVPGLKSAPEGTLSQGTGYQINGSSDGRGTVISVPKPSSAAVPDAPPAGNAAPASRPVPVAVKPAAPAPARTATPAAPKPAVQTKIHDDYWVQTGAFSTIGKAEGVKDTLATKGITSIIENREVEGRTLFRVRVGPYTSQNEANYWLSLIRTINGFEDSQVRLTQTRR